MPFSPLVFVLFCFPTTFRGLIAEHTQPNVVASPEAAIELSSRRPSQRRDHMGSTPVLYSVFAVCRLFLGVPRHQKPVASRPSSSTAERAHLLGGEKKNTRLWRPKGVVGRMQNSVSLEAPPISFTAWSVGWILEPRVQRETGRKRRRAEVVPRSRAMIAGICTESTIPTRGKDSQPFGLTPDIILYRNRTINIYI